MSYVVLGLARVIDSALWLYLMVIVAAAVTTWVSADPRNPIVAFLRNATEPLYRWLRRKLPFSTTVGTIDFTPILIIFTIEFLRIALVQNLVEVAQWLGS